MLRSIRTTSVSRIARLLLDTILDWAIDKSQDMALGIALDTSNGVGMKLEIGLCREASQYPHFTQIQSWTTDPNQTLDSPNEIIFFHYVNSEKAHVNGMMNHFDIVNFP